ncbi:hypothetical protein NQ228_25245, partial [Escherichia coli]|nr:hypothetical protein [Escherichia coli]
YSDSSPVPCNGSLEQTFRRNDPQRNDARFQKVDVVNTSPGLLQDRSRLQTTWLEKRANCRALGHRKASQKHIPRGWLPVCLRKNLPVPR